MAKHWLTGPALLFLFAAEVLGAQSDSGHSGAWSGVIINGDWYRAQRRRESSGVLRPRSVRPGANSDYSQGGQRNRSALLSFGRLVALLQRPAGRAARRQVTL